MPRLSPWLINTYSRSRPRLKKAEDDAFTEMCQLAHTKNKAQSRGLQALQKIEESGDDLVDGDVDVKAVKTRPRSRWTTQSKVAQHKSDWRATPLQVEGKKFGTRKCSPMIDLQETEEADEDSIVYLTESLDESSTLSDTDLTPVNTEDHEDSYSQYSDIELPRDLPDSKRKSRSTSNRILKLSQAENVHSSSVHSGHVKRDDRRTKPMHSTLLEGKHSALNLDQYGISDISGNSKRPEETQTVKGRSVYSLLSSDDDDAPLQSLTTEKKTEPLLQRAGKKLSLIQKSHKASQRKPYSRENFSQDGRKQVSFVLGTKPDFNVFDPAKSIIQHTSPAFLPHRSPSSSILKKSAHAEARAPVDDKMSRATSTPQKPARSSRKGRGCHIMDLSFDISAVSLPMDNDLVMSSEPPVTADEKETEGDSGTHVGTETEMLLDVEPISLEASQNFGLVSEMTPEKTEDKRKNTHEITPSSQVKRSSPEAGAPSRRQLAKKSRFVKPVRISLGPDNRKRLDYSTHSQPPPALAVPDAIPDCIITTLPFTGYKISERPRATSTQSLVGTLDIQQLINLPQDVLETIPDSAFHQHSSFVPGLPV